ncbi:TetR/AcrR family transcriptional regulator [Actinoplanes sp. NPDC024001]|uniref:TetR/AcrR family transcriptional regulator n=1 Tax=Actinoplanes sp. NPDC024001 TaxID=3154598 RepID=UPI0034079AEC
MPRQVDHQQRRHQIAEAVWRLAVRGGLETVTLRHVAAEAGVPARQLQYYFGTREQLLLGALEILNTDAELRAAQRMATLGDNPQPLVRGILLELLPLDDERRKTQIVYAAYFVRFLTDPALAPAARDDTHALEALVASMLHRGQELGLVDAKLDAVAEAAFLVAAAQGLQSAVLLGQYSPQDAINLIDHQLNRLFPSADG